MHERPIYLSCEREDVVGLDATIIMHPNIWKASGHVDTFSDPMIDCKVCKGRFRADQTGDLRCPQKPSRSVAECPEEKTAPRAFNLMFQTYVGPLQSEENIAYLRPETAQAIFAQFKNVHETSRQKVPFGICQIGKAFRNEINPRNYTFRSREFEQMELEFFIRPDEAIEGLTGAVCPWTEGADLSEPRPDWGWEMWHRYWVDQRVRFYASIGLGRDVLDFHWQKQDELAHYAKACVDILFKFPFGTEELEGIAARGDFDLGQHQKHAGKSMEVFDDELKVAFAKWDDARKQALVQRRLDQEQAKPKGGLAPDAVRAWCDRLFAGFYVPHVIEPSAGLDRLALAVLCQAYDEDRAPDDKGKEEVRTVLRFSPRVAPFKAAVFPLLKNKPELGEKARRIHRDLGARWLTFYDESGAIGRRYRRQDEAGTPFGFTIDFQTLADDTVTWRERDSMQQVRVPVGELATRLEASL